MLDVHHGGMFDMVYTSVSQSGTNKSFADAINARENFPHFCAYVEKFRAHPSIAPYRFR